MDAITLLKEDHRNVERLFARFASAGDRAYAEKRRLADRIIEALVQHADIEERYLYPVARETVPGTEDVVLESLEEHHIVKVMLAELDAMDPTDERFDAKMTVLAESVRHHVKEEEQEFFPKVREALGRSALADLGQTMETAKRNSPTHPHPRSPDTPPANFVAGLASGVVDRFRDTLNGVAQGSVAAMQDLVARFLGRPSRVGAPTGTSVARRTASTVRARSDAATDDAIAAAERAKRTVTSAGAGARRTRDAAVDTASDTVRAARSGAKGTATSARTSAKRTAATAKRAATTTRRTAATGATRTASTARRAARRTRQTATAG